MTQRDEPGAGEQHSPLRLLAIRMEEYNGSTYPLFTVGDYQITTNSIRPPERNDAFSAIAIVTAVNERPALLARVAELEAAMAEIVEEAVPHVQAAERMGFSATLEGKFARHTLNVARDALAVQP